MQAATKGVNGQGDDMQVPRDWFKVRGGIRVVPRVGGGFRADSGWPMASLKADRETIVLKEAWAGSLVVTRQNLIAIRPWRYAINRGLEFDVQGQDELWIFRTQRPERVSARLASLAWDVPQPPR